MHHTFVALVQNKPGVQTRIASLRRRLSFALFFVILATTTFAQTPTALKAAATPTNDPTWWKHAVIYEIYPRSFQDSNGDGIGDLNGITQRLDYLQTLGIDAIWISPMYPSPQIDFGYDISDYESVDPQYGTLADFDHLVAEAKKRNIRIVLDMVLNHTSDKHQWFIDAASSRTNPKHDWYVWSDGKPGTGPNSHEGKIPPNNWVALFGGSAWQWVPAVHQFYYHKFYKQQPDLNWRNPAVEKAMFGAMQFWLDRGVAGYRLDAVPTLFEDPQLRDEPVAAPGLNAQGDPNLNDLYTNNLPEVHNVLRRMRALVDKYPSDKYPGNRVLIGETYLPNTAALLPWYGTPAHPELQLPMDLLVGFHTEGGGPNSPNVHLSLPHFRQSLTEMETGLGTNQPLLVFDNHDNTRSWDRFGEGATPDNKLRIAKLIATVLYTTRSTALTYYGAEIGMTTHTPTRKEDVKDPIGITGWPKEKGRDGERTPMQWTPAAPGSKENPPGFSTNPHTWLPIGADYATVNVQSELGQPDTLLTWTHDLIDLRRSYPAMHNGGIVMLDTQNPSVLSYARTAPTGQQPIFISVNFTDQYQTIHPNLAAAGLPDHYTWVHMDAPIQFNSGKTLTTITLPPYAAIITGLQ
jgi:alpha-glucosidase